MALYVVVRHRQNTHQTYVNSWIDDESLEAIETPREVADMCEQAMRKNEKIFVHRCGWADSPPTVCCSALVEQVGVIGEQSSLVTFANQAVLNALPPVTPTLGQNYYFADPM